MLKFMLKKNTSIKMFFKPRRRKLETLLRPPYRHKISRHQITISRYSVIVSFYTQLKNKFVVPQPANCINILKEVSSTFKFFETNICYTHCIKIRVFLICPSFFKLMNYKIL